MGEARVKRLMIDHPTERQKFLSYNAGMVQGHAESLRRLADTLLEYPSGNALMYLEVEARRLLAVVRVLRGPTPKDDTP